MVIKTLALSAFLQLNNQIFVYMVFNIKQHYPIIFIIVLANANIAYCQSHYIVPRVATYNSFSGIDFSVGYAFVPKYGEGEVLTRLVIAPIAIGIEHRRNVTGYKLSAEVDWTIFACRINGIQYNEQNKPADVRIRPEIGITLLNLLSFFYGNNIPIGKTELDNVPRHQYTLALNIPIEL